MKPRDSFFFFKDKQDWSTVRHKQTHQEKKERKWTQINKIRNKREVTTDTTEMQSYNKILQTTICQQTGQSRRNALIPRHIQSFRTELRRKNTIKIFKIKLEKKKEKIWTDQLQPRVLNY